MRKWVYLFVALALVGIVLGQHPAIFANRRVGINTNNPQASLHITPVLAGQNYFRVDDTNGAMRFEVGVKNAGLPAVWLPFGYTPNNTNYSFAAGADTLLINAPADTVANAIYFTLGEAGKWYISSTSLSPVSGNIADLGTAGQPISTLFVTNVLANGNVGIGTNAPSAPLSVARAFAGNSAYFLGEVGILTDNPLFPLDVRGNIAGTAFFDIDNSNYYIDPNSGTTSAILAGNVGIGTTAPLGRLHSVSSSGHQGIFSGWNPVAGAGAEKGAIVVGTNPAYQGVLQFNDSGVTTLYLDSTYNQASAEMKFRMRTAGTPVDALTILGSGNVGIGTAAPTKKLDVQGPGGSILANISASSIGTGYVLETIGNDGGLLYLGKENSAGGTFTDTLPYASLVGDSATALQFITASTAKMSILGTGNVGIGTTAPVHKLHVFAPDTSNPLDYIAMIQNADQTAGQGHGLRIQAGNNASDIPFHVSDRAGTTPFLTVLGSGNVGIGTSSPDSLLGLGASTGSKINLYDGAVYDLGIQTDTMQFIIPGSGQSFQFGTGTSASFSKVFGVQGNGNAVLSGHLTTTNGLASFATNIVASINAAGYTNSPTAPGTGTGINMNVHVVGTSGTIVFYNRSGVNGQTVCGTPLWTNTTAIPIGMVIPVPVNCGIQIVSGVGVTMQAYAQ